MLCVFLNLETFVENDQVFRISPSLSVQILRTKSTNFCSLLFFTFSYRLLVLINLSKNNFFNFDH